VQVSTQKIIIAIDGPAGSGKSTLASRLARKLGYVNIESGAMYRALALKAVMNDVSVQDEAALVSLAHQSRIHLEPKIDGNRVLLDGEDVSMRVRDQDVTEAASKVSVHPKVREWMVARQREMGQQGGVVMEGRDIGTKVFPEAEVKIFLDAAPEVRGDRRFKQDPLGAGERQPEEVLKELRERDHRDRTRVSSPLAPAVDAVVIDSTRMGIEEVVQRAEDIIEKKLPRSPASP